ncbi:hypothetical protein SH668x_003588 [Planctomicrobium sp. SH668]|uniref:hypothetical protein n=1 Tax=Planctomicrobium sp. SH668 TaxID=3448126 RepID=UPI003F5AF4B9
MGEKTRGKFVYFGPWNDWESAKRRSDEQKDDLFAGRTPVVRGEGLNLRDLANHYLTHKTRQVDAGELSTRTFRDCHRACERVIDAFEKDKLVSSLLPEDFGRLRERLSQTLGPVALGVEIQRIRSIFKFGMDSELVSGRVAYGKQFGKLSKNAVRAAKLKKGVKDIRSEELRAVIDEATKPLKAMILLAINGGFGNHDVAQMPQVAINLESKMDLSVEF